ncbi:MAG: TatD family hydrolase [Candidatus Pacebacteria bacterium]|nr:TatD family hydrolase [Candidatus Paceibacterota bacterium]MDD2757179.1 TatD family hydrolase [Candidatus Paceibacterota bacterium]MDD3283649.1 TatD family hydrolase [Candidatus Paceibacterota bacterium]MDD3969728.1 TatD family hydrolase [Candidatus Paceibacterota bacterium]MDD4737677.1 TatD family hydrolase [Candidatus Paceibacterota bacterium]
MIIDTHAHLNFIEFNNDREELIDKLIKSNYQIINIGTNKESSRECVSLSRHGVYASVGLHPLNVESKLKIKGEIEKKEDNFDYDYYKKLSENNGVVAIGEAGLDYWYKPKGTARKEEYISKQKEVLEKQLDLAKEVNLPIIIHCRSAFDDLIEILSRKNIPGVVHCFTGTKENAEKLLKLGYYFGINGIIFKVDLKDSIKAIPLERMLLETDCPYLSPPNFEERNCPFSIDLIIDEISRIKGVSRKEIIDKTTINAKNLFKIDY